MAGSSTASCSTPEEWQASTRKLQIITIVWMVIECSVAAYAAFTARSPSMLAFGSDSLVELLSATVVLMQFTGRPPISEETAARVSALLLFALAAVVVGTSIASLWTNKQPETTWPGIAISFGALVIMPLLATAKRRQARRSGNAALAADAVQSATCAYLALLTLVGVGLNALTHHGQIDSVAALLAVPLLLKEGREAWKGTVCHCC